MTSFIRKLTQSRLCIFFLLLAESRRPVSDSFAAGFSYRDSPSVSKEPLRKATSDATAGSDPVWKRASGGPLLRQASADAGKAKPFARQLSKGVSKVVSCY